MCQLTFYTRKRTIGQLRYWGTCQDRPFYIVSSWPIVLTHHEYHRYFPHPRAGVPALTPNSLSTYLWNKYTDQSLTAVKHCRIVQNKIDVETVRSIEQKRIVVINRIASQLWVNCEANFGQARRIAHCVIFKSRVRHACCFLLITS